MRTKSAWLALAGLLVGVAVTALWAAGPKTANQAPAAGPLQTLSGVMTSAPADEPGGRLRQFIGGRIGRLLTLRSELGLTDAQREQVRAVVQSHKKEIATVLSGVVEKRRALHAAVVANPPDETAIRKAADELGKSIGDAAVLASKVVGELRPILTPEQIERLKKFRADNMTATDDFLKGLAE